MNARNLTLVLPAYNEANRLPTALDELFGYLASGSHRPGLLPPQIHVLVVDAGSTDGTAQVVRSRADLVRSQDGVRLDLISTAGRGKGAAVAAGVLAAHSDIIVFADADMAAPPDQLPRLIEALSTADVALGSRIQPDGYDMRVTQPFYRRVLGRLFHVAASWAASGIDDTQCGFKGFRREAAHDLFARLRVPGMVFDVELIHLCRRRGYRVAVVPIQWRDRDGSRMRIGPRLAVRVAWDLLRIPLMHRGVTQAERQAGASSGESYAISEDGRR